MSQWIGPEGALSELRWAGEEAVSVDTRHVVTTSQVGWSQARRLAARPRTWEMSTDCLTPEDTYLLEGLADGHRNAEPLVFYSALASASNILTPRQTRFASGEWSAGAQLGGRAMPAAHEDRFWMSIGPNPRLTHGVPVPAGHPVTVSSYVTSTGDPATRPAQRVDEYSLDGRLLRSHVASGLVDATQARVHSSFTTNPACVRLVIRWTEVLAMSRPCVTLTDAPRKYSTGRGCVGAVVHVGTSATARALHRTHHWSDTTHDVSFTVQEVGFA